MNLVERQPVVSERLVPNEALVPHFDEQARVQTVRLAETKQNKQTNKSLEKSVFVNKFAKHEPRQ